MTTISILNLSSMVADEDVAAVVSALQKQVSEHVTGFWPVADAKIVFLPAATPDQADQAAWICSVLDDPDQADALGYHDKTPAGLPFIKVFVKPTKEAGVSLSSVLSHEIVEELINSEIDSLALIDNNDGTGTLVPQEGCDAVQANTYEVDGVQVSDFVLPSYFDTHAPGPWDYLGALTGPMPALAAGGYTNWRPITPQGLGNWTQSFADGRAMELAKLFGMRAANGQH